MSPPSTTSLAIMALCARPAGMRNDEPTRALLARMTGLPPMPSTSVSPRLTKFQARGLILADRSSGQIVYRATAKGLRYIERGRNQPAAPRRPTVLPVKLGTWQRTPMVGQPTKPAPKPAVLVQYGVSAGYDKRVQCSPEEAAALRVSGYYSSGAYRSAQR